MAALRNLNNIIEADVSEETQIKLCNALTNPENIKKSKQMPFRFATAFDNVKDNRKFTDAISEAMDIAVSNTPEFKGKTLIAVDCSGSMDGDPLNKASIFGATLVKANTNADLILYDTSIKELTISSRTPVVDIVKAIKQIGMGGGTQTSLVFDYALSKGVKYDRFIIISDNESWIEGYYGKGGVQGKYTEYKKKTGTDPFIYAIDIEGYGTKDVTGNKVFHICGWSDRLLDFVGKAEEGQGLVDYIKGASLDK